MNANVAMQVATTRKFGDLEIQVYENPEVGHTKAQDDFWMTREQIGTALEYKNPSISIGTIHKRNAGRLDPLSGLINLITPGGKQQTYVYNMRGVMEICRYSTQPFCWDVVTALMRGETVSLKQMDSKAQADTAGLAAKRQANFELLNTHLKDIGENQQILFTQMDSLEKSRAEDRQAIENAISYIKTVIKQANQLTTKVDMVLMGISKPNVVKENVSSQPEPQSVAQPEQIQQKPVKRYIAPKAETSWRHDEDVMAKAIAKVKGTLPGYVRGWFNNMLKNDYGWSVHEERRLYAKEHSIDVGTIALVEIVEMHPTYRSIYFNKMAEMYEECTGKKMGHITERPPIVPADALPKRRKFEENPSVVVEAHAVEIETPVVETPAEVADRITKRKYYKPSVFVPIVEPVAQKRGDTSFHYQLTYRAIYELIGVDAMHRLEKSYIKKHGKTPKTRTELFKQSDRAMNIFKDAVCKLDAIS